MTRTETLGLYTWVESDPVSLTQMNENFTTLDGAAGRVISRADAANVNVAGLLLHNRYADRDISFAQNVMIADLARAADAQSYEQLYFSKNGACVLSEGYSGETVSPRKPNGSAIVLSNAVSPVTLWTMQPDGYAELQKLNVVMVSNVSVKFTDQILLYSGGVLVARSNEYVKSDTTAVRIFDYTFENVILDPNRTYEVRMTTTSPTARTIANATVTATPLVYTGGWLACHAADLPTGCERAIINVYAGGTAPQLEWRVNSGTYSVAASAGQTAAKSPSGVACRLYRYEIPLNADARTLQLRFHLLAADSIVHGVAGAIL